MNARLNLPLLNTTSFDSGSLGLAAMVIHQFPEEGHYVASVSLAGAVVAEQAFLVEVNSPSFQLDIDLAQRTKSSSGHDSGCACSQLGESAPSVSPKGFVLFHVTRGSGYSVTVAKIGEKPVFDSTKLGSGDLFAVSLLEPAQYSVTNSLGTARAAITVEFNADLAKRLKSLQPVYVEVTPTTFEPSQIRLASSQGLVFRVKEKARIVIEKAKSGPKVPSKPTIKWRKFTQKS